MLPAGVNVGRHTYGYDAATFQVFMTGACIRVGAFCSIGPEVRILAGSEHVMARASTFPFEALLFDPAGGNAAEAIDKGVTTIGNDVWIGLGATILSGVIIGDGAVVGAGAVVSKPVSPYAVVAGNPARVIGHRFGDEVRRRLLLSKWWDWTDEKIGTLRYAFKADVEYFLEVAEQTRESAD